MSIHHYTIRNIGVDIINPPPSMGRTWDELRETAETWRDYAEAVSRGEAEGITVHCGEHGVIRPEIVRRDRHD